MQNGKFYRCFYSRVHGDLEDYLDWEVFASDKREACLLSFAALSDLYAASTDEARAKAAQLVAQRLGEHWTVEQFLNADMQLWPDSATCCTIRDILD